MATPVRAFLHSLIDYAGLFPPAKLKLDPAVRNYTDYRRGDDQWMLGRFIIPASRLEELDSYASLFSESKADNPFAFSVLGKPAESIFGTLDLTLETAKTFESSHEGNTVTDLFEFKLPPDALDKEVLADLLHQAGEKLKGSLLRPASAFFEVPLMSDNWERSLDVAAQALSDHRSAEIKLGLKFRLGGVTEDLFPPVDAVARALYVANQAGVPFKGTAGLHHPVRHFAASVDTMMHGFLNVFGGAILTQVHNLDAPAIERIVSDEVADHFVLNTDGLTWMDLHASAEQIQSARQSFATSYGSCSFDEPREDLREMGILTPETASA